MKPSTLDAVKGGGRPPRTVAGHRPALPPTTARSRGPVRGGAPLAHPRHVCGRAGCSGVTERRFCTVCGPHGARCSSPRRNFSRRASAAGPVTAPGGMGWGAWRASGGPSQPGGLPASRMLAIRKQLVEMMRVDQRQGIAWLPTPISGSDGLAFPSGDILGTLAFVEVEELRHRTHGIGPAEKPARVQHLVAPLLHRLHLVYQSEKGIRVLVIESLAPQSLDLVPDLACRGCAGVYLVDLVGSEVPPEHSKFGVETASRDCDASDPLSAWPRPDTSAVNSPVKIARSSVSDLTRPARRHEAAFAAADTGRSCGNSATGSRQGRGHQPSGGPSRSGAALLRALRTLVGRVASPT